MISKDENKGALIMIPLQEEIQNIVEQIVKRYKPISIILFGSCAKG